jgi:hypothetical protein
MRRSCWPDAAVSNSFKHFRERVLDDREPQRRDFFEAVPAAGDEGFLIADEGGVELAFVEGPFDGDRCEVVRDDVLRERGIAADVALFGGVEHFGVEEADDVTQVEIAIGELGHVLAAYVAEVAFVAFGHSSRGARSRERGVIGVNFLSGR